MSPLACVSCLRILADLARFNHLALVNSLCAFFSAPTQLVIMRCVTHWQTIRYLHVRVAPEARQHRWVRAVSVSCIHWSVQHTQSASASFQWHAHVSNESLA